MSDEPTIRANRIQGIRELVDLLEAQPEIPMPVGFAWSNAYTFEDSLPAKEMARLMKPVNKRVTASFYQLEKKFTGGVTFKVNYDRENVCERVVTGTREVPAETIHVKAHTEEIIEWICPDSLLGNDV